MSADDVIDEPPRPGGSTRSGVGIVVRRPDGRVLVAGVLVDVPQDADPRVLEPDKFAAFAWIDPADPPEPLFPLAAALLERL